MLDDLRFAARRLARSPGFALTAALSLILGIGAGAAAFSVIDAVRFRALPFQQGDRLVVLGETAVAPGGPGAAADCRGGCDVSYETFANVLKTFPFRTVDVVAGFTSGLKALNLGGEPIPVMGGVVSQNLFTLLGVEPELGRVFRPEDDALGVELVTVISHDLWVNHLGADPGIIGKVIKLSDSRYTVVGVMPEGFKHEVASMFWLPSVPTLDPSTRPSIRSLTVVGRLRPGATVEQFRAELQSIDPAVLQGARQGNAAPMTLTAVPLRDRYTSATQSHDLIFAAVVACVVLIAAANLANMILVRSLSQRREFAVRSALGAGTGRLIRQLLSEQLILVAVATVFGLLFGSWLLGVLERVEVLQSLRPAGMDYRIDGRAVAFAVGLAALLALALSLVPARLASRRDLQSTLRLGGAHPAGGGSWAQRGFVVTQLALAVVLAASGGLMTKTVLRLSSLDLGFASGSLVEGSPSFPHPWRVKEKYVPVTRQITAELAALPGVASVGIRATAALAPRGAPAPQISVANDASPLAATLVPRAGTAVDTGYFRTIGVTMARGRDFGPQDSENAPPVAIVNDWAATRWWPGRDPIGQIIQVDTAPGLPLRLEVVGVVRNNKAAQPNLLLAEDGPELYRPLDQAPSAFPTFLIRTAGAPGPLLKPIKEVLVRLVPDRPLSATPVADQVDRQLAGVRVNAYQILGFAAVGLFLAVIGVYGVLSYVVGTRTREIGIRGALGAGTGRIRTMILRDTAILAAAGLLIGIPAAGFATRLLTSLLHGTNPTDPTVLALVGVVVVAVALAAAWLPARRAARVDPLVALRTD